MIIRSIRAGLAPSWAEENRNEYDDFLRRRSKIASIFVPRRKTRRESRRPSRCTTTPTAIEGQGPPTDLVGDGPTRGGHHQLEPLRRSLELPTAG